MPLWAEPSVAPAPAAAAPAAAAALTFTDPSHPPSATTTADSNDGDNKDNDDNDDAAAAAVEEEDVDTFEALGVPRALLRGIAKAGFERPTHCQSVAIPAVLKGRDVLMQAPAGTGKTAAFAIGGLARLLGEKSGSTMLVLSPTKDLACQTHGLLDRLAKATNTNIALATHVSYGGKHGDTADLNGVLCRSSRVAMSAAPSARSQPRQRPRGRDRRV